MESTDSRPRGVVQKVAGEVRDHPFAYGVMAAFLVLGPVLASLIFPEAPLGVTIIGGFVFGAWAALCAVPGKFV